MLIENTLFGTRDKVQTAIARLREFEPPEGYWVAFSGGKDSIVIKDLVKRAGVKAEYHFNLTTVDPPELIYFIRQYHPDVIVDRPPKSMWQLIVENGLPPTRMQRWCCRYLKERGGKGRLVITGVRWEESARRKNRHMIETCMTDNSKRYLHPIIDWTTNDVWQYIKQNNIPYCSLYDEGWKRIGCVLCPLANKQQQQQEEARWPKIAEAYKRACIATYNKLVKEGKKPKFCDSGEELYEWFLGRLPRYKPETDQTLIFE